MKICKKCNNERPETSFARTGTSEFSRKNTCNRCVYKRNRELNPDKERIKNYRRRYSMTLEKYQEIYNEQQGLCKICGDFYTTLVVDHCHSSNAVRGLLCSNCNTGLGLYKDRSDLLGKTILYLKETNTDKSNI